MKDIAKDVIEALLVLVMVFVLTVTNLFGSVDYMLKDITYQIPRGVSNQIKVIAIDEKTLEELGPIGTWSRQYYADLINVLNANEVARPTVIGFDIIFSGYFNGDDEETGGDVAFATACKESGNVVVASQIEYSEKPEKNEKGLLVYPVEKIYNPYEELAQQVEVGFANVSQDSDGVVRRVQLAEEYQGQNVSLFSKKVYDIYCDQLDITSGGVEVDKYGRAIINYSGKPGDYEAISMVDVLNGKIDSKAFQDSIVLVGAYANGMQDNFQVPNDYSKQMYGVEIHANVVQALMENHFSINGNPILAGIVLGVIAAWLHFMFKRSKVWLSAVLLIGAIGIEIIVGMALNNRGISISLIYLPVVLTLSFVYCLALRYILESRRRKKMLNAFKKYVAPEIVEELSKKGDFTVKLGGENRDIAVLFVDIRGFTTMSEVLTPEEVVEILNHYLNLTTNAIFKNKGTLDKFVGDATMAVFNSPFDLEDYEFHAVCAAMDIVEGGKALEKELLEKYGRSVGFGVGVNCGPAVVGNIGCEFRMDFTAIGDTVNTAARLESNAAKGQVLISQDVYDRLTGRIEVECIGEIPLKGKSKGVCVYSVLDVHRDE
ncbi:MAG: adenylate/guanylate cyclase domain-containing protein [Lachnospiraceae bacterium]|nr:adenylate/guanylate cyclase domain-containing protein [Lachnospiraceae bacterium]